MARIDRKRRLERYEALLARRGDLELLNSFDELIRVMSEKRHRRSAPKAAGRKRHRGDRHAR